MQTATVRIDAVTKTEVRAVVVRQNLPGCILENRELDAGRLGLELDFELQRLAVPAAITVAAAKTVSCAECACLHPDSSWLSHATINVSC